MDLREKTDKNIETIIPDFSDLDQIPDSFGHDFNFEFFWRLRL